MERVLLKTVHRLMHKPTLELRAAVAADDTDLVSVLAGLFDAAPSPAGLTAGDAGLPAADPDTTARPCHPALDVKRRDVRAVEHAGHERRVHRADQLAM